VLGVEHDARPDAASPFAWAARPADPGTAATIADRMPPLPGYQSDINLQAEAWVRDLGRWLRRGAAVLIDYGFPQAEYYHPQRLRGTLMCHFRHHAHDQALVLAGLQDITAHVDFTAMADAALEGGLDVMGYTSQARFLMNAGLTDLIQAPGIDPAQRARQMAALNTLLSEAEMGELFKVLAVGRGLDGPLLGFARGDRRDRL
jgi:SAM-dependent MidA family methyltransferase